MTAFYIRATRVKYLRGLDFHYADIKGRFHNILLLHDSINIRAEREKFSTS